MADRDWKEMHQAADDDNQELILHLLNKGIDINARDKKGLTPLHKAAFLDHVNVARILVQHGANLEAKDKRGKTALDIAFKQGHVNVISLLENADKNRKKDNANIQTADAKKGNQPDTEVDPKKEIKRFIKKISEKNRVSKELENKILSSFEQKEQKLLQIELKIRVLITELSRLIKILNTPEPKYLTDSDGITKPDVTRDNVTILIDRVVENYLALRQQLELNDFERELIREMQFANEEKDLQVKKLGNIFEELKFSNVNRENKKEIVKKGDVIVSKTIESDDKLKAVTAVKDGAVKELQRVIEEITKLNQDNSVSIEKLQECLQQLTNGNVLIYAPINISNVNHGSNSGKIKIMF